MPAWISYEVSNDELQKLEAGEALDYDNDDGLPAYDGQTVQLILDGRSLVKYCLAAKDPEGKWKLTLKKEENK